MSTPEALNVTTHTVENQPTALTDYNAFDGDLALQDALRLEGAANWFDTLSDYGAQASGRLASLGIEANTHPPRLDTHDRYGHRLDQVVFHPSYHQLMTSGLAAGIGSLTWRGAPKGRIARSALLYLHHQFEAGTVCPMTMTHAAVPALECQPDVAAAWVPGILGAQYDPDFRPATEKRGLTIGMAMTEKQGGSDVRANTTRAMPLAQAGAGALYRLRGHKWFCSAPMSDAFLSLAQTPEGLSCFLVPRWRPDGTVNSIQFLRLKHKLGNTSNASAEIEYLDAWGWLLGEPGRGVATIIKMVAETRLDCALGSAALMRQAVAQAIDHCQQRRAFGAFLADQPLMINVLADLALESELATRFAVFLAGCFDHATVDETAEHLARIGTPIAKYWLCKRAVHVVNEAQECLGGAGYIEDFILPRLYRDAPVNAIWEGSGNIQCLDVLRAIEREPGRLEAVLSWATPMLADWPAAGRLVDQIKGLVSDRRNIANQARQLASALALLFQARIVHQANQPLLAELFVEGRLKPGAPALFGNLPPGLPFVAMIERAQPRTLGAST